MEDKTSKRGKKETRFEDLDQELLGKEIEVALQSYGTFYGKLVASSKFWIKLDMRGKAVYINKPFIVFIKPV
ncbi:MAG: hypothetical protein ACP5IE_02560 [Infirmifilum sp.]